MTRSPCRRAHGPPSRPAPSHLALDPAPSITSTRVDPPWQVDLDRNQWPPWRSRSPEVPMESVCRVCDCEGDSRGRRSERLRDPPTTDWTGRQSGGAKPPTKGTVSKYATRQAETVIPVGSGLLQPLTAATGGAMDREYIVSARPTNSEIDHKFPSSTILKPKKRRLTFWSLLLMLDPQVKVAVLAFGFFLIHLFFFGLESYKESGPVGLHPSAKELDAQQLVPDLAGPQQESEAPLPLSSTRNELPPQVIESHRDRLTKGPYPKEYLAPGWNPAPAQLGSYAQRGRGVPDGLKPHFPDGRPERTVEPLPAEETDAPCPNCIHAPLTANTDYKPDQFAWKQTDQAPVHCYSLGPKSDKHCVFQPLCYDKTDSSLLLAEGERACSGFNRSISSLRSSCTRMTEQAIRESNFDSVRALGDESNDAVWVEGTTVLQLLDRSCGNIAHFAGRIFYLNHVISNYASYYLKQVDNVILLPGDDVMKRFSAPARYGFWHKHIFEAIVYPFVPSFSSKAVLSPESDTRRVAVLPSLNIGDPNKRYVCFRKIIIPGYMKGRFFAWDREIPSVEDSWTSAHSRDSPELPREAMRFRANAYALLRKMSRVPQIKKKIVFLDRTGTRRAILEEDKEKLTGLLRNAATKHGYTFETILFDSMTAREQVDSVSDAAIAVAVHGAQIVNSIFMPPLAVLFELFPFSFSHDMYVEGGRAGLKYYSHTLLKGEKFPNSESLGYTSPAKCIHESRECKIFYRDNNLRFDKEDFLVVQRTLEKAFSYLESLRE